MAPHVWRPCQPVGYAPTGRDRDRFDVAAKSDHAMSDADKRTAVRAALVERFHLRAHMETRQERVYELRFERSDHRLGPSLRQRDDCSQVPPPGALPCGTGFNAFTAGVVRFGGITIERLGTFVFSNDLNQLVLDRTGLPGMYDVDLQWKASRPEDTGNDPAAELRPEFFTAVREQLGLKLEPARAPVGVVIVDHAEPPGAD